MIRLLKRTYELTKRGQGQAGGGSTREASATTAPPPLGEEMVEREIGGTLHHPRITQQSWPQGLPPERSDLGNWGRNRYDWGGQQPLPHPRITLTHWPSDRPSAIWFKLHFRNRDR